MSKLMSAYAIGEHSGMSELRKRGATDEDALNDALNSLGSGAHGWIQLENGRWLRRDAIVTVWLEPDEAQP